MTIDGLDRDSIDRPRTIATAAMRVLNARRRMVVLGLKPVLVPDPEVPQSGP
jgi:hypothetical protein